MDPNISGNPYPIYPSSFSEASTADNKEYGVTEATQILLGGAKPNDETGVAASKMGVAESQLGIAEAVNPLGVATPDMVTVSEIGAATPEMDGGVLKL